MHRPPAERPSAALRAALARCSRRLAPDSGRMLLVALVLTLTGSVFAALPDSGRAGSAEATSLAVDAASQTVAVTANDSRTSGDEHTSDWRRRHRAEGNTPQTPAAATNGNCSLIVPADPTSAAGLTTPYRLTATDPRQGTCHEANADQSAFVEAAIFDPATHTVAIYHPLVIDDHSEPAVPTAPLMLPGRAVVGVWFGFNGDTLTLSGQGARSCVNGLPGSPFGQFAYCNAAAFFSAANADVAFQKTIPAIGTVTTRGPAGRPCPTSRDFSVVDQDQSDNLATAYRIIGGRMAQVTSATAKRGTPLTNGSDEGLVAKFIAPTLGCKPFTAPDLNDDMAPTPALALNELSAAKFQPAPAALVPISDPMALVDGHTSVQKTNLYRAGVNQPPLPTGQTPQAYCAGILAAAPASLTTNAAVFRAATSPSPDQPSLLAFLTDRLTTTVENLGCAPLHLDPGSGQANGQPATGTTGTAGATSTSQAPGVDSTTTNSQQHGAAVATPAAPSGSTPSGSSGSGARSSGSGSSGSTGSSSAISSSAPSASGTGSP
jgi:hypothetical protein